MKTNETETKPETKTVKHQCGFCYTREQGKNGEVKREWSEDFKQFIPVCKKHSWGGMVGLS